MSVDGIQKGDVYKTSYELDNPDYPIRPKAQSNYFTWYMRPDVKFEIIKFLQRREMMFYRKGLQYTFRYMRCHNIQTLGLFQKNAGAFKHLHNIYNSVATYIHGMDWFGYNLLRRDSDSIEKWKASSHKIMRGYDFFIDIDAPSLDELEMTKKSALVLWDLFNKFQVPFECRYSGMGFHFLIPSSVLPKMSFDPYSDTTTIYEYLRAIAKKLQTNISAYIDSSIYDMRRVCKTPYSLAVYEHGEYVCLPMTMRDDVKLFKIEDVMVETWFMKSVRGRGTMLFNKIGNRQSFQAFVDYIVDKWGELDYGK